ncbi:unnamed protein product [Victoria cruziana]
MAEEEVLEINLGTQCSLPLFLYHYLNLLVVSALVHSLALYHRHHSSSHKSETLFLSHTPELRALVLFSGIMD